MFGWLKNKSNNQAPDDSQDDMAGRTFLDGAYRAHRAEDIGKYTALAVATFPDLENRITCFGSDWLGRQFATDEARLVRGERQILLLEPGTGEALEIPVSLDIFYTEELIHQPDAAVAFDFFQNWLSSGGKVPSYGQCVGYKKPLYLGGEDDITNVEITDFEVYWCLSAQLLKQIRGLPEGAVIDSVSITD